MSKNGHLEFRVRWLPYQLSPGSSEEPSSRVEGYAAKFGKTNEQIQQMFQGIQQRFAKVGLPYSLEDPKISNTREAHRLLTIAYKEGPEAQDKAAEVLFNGYFGEGRAPNEPALLEAAAIAAGLDASIIADRSVSGDELDKELAEGRKMVTSGVPHFVFSPEGGKAVAEFAGAQPVEEFLDAFAKASK